MTKDPLLAAAHVFLALCIALLVFVMGAMIVGLGALLTVGRGEIYADLATTDAPASAYWAVIFVLVLSEALLFLGLRFVFELRGIVRSVDRGDPFEPANADRLARMGWFAVGVNALALAIGAIAVWIKSVVGEAGVNVDVDFDLGGGGILLILVLFILARVFRQGAAMREDLEGTV